MLKKTIRPEFLNRIDETIMFQPLNKPQIEQIVRLQINGIRKMLEGNGVTLQMTDAAVTSWPLQVTILNSVHVR